MEGASVAQEFNKIKNEWKTIDKKPWQMAIWVCEYQDLEILDKFMDIEASPLGCFDDLFFRFQTFFETPQQYEQQLWNEFLAWFEKPQDVQYDIIGALKDDSFLDKDYQVNHQLPPTFQSIIQEFKRLKDHLDLQDINFILYFPPATFHQNGWNKWFENQLLQGKLPSDIRFASIDFRQDRVLDSLQSILGKGNIRELYVDLNMLAALRNEMDKDSTSGKPNSPVGQFQKQVRKVMDATANKKIDLDKETEVLKTLAYRINILNTKSTAHLVNSIAFSSVEKIEKAFIEVNKAIELTTPAMASKQEGAYPVWRAAMLLKAALYLTNEDKEQAIFCYQKVTEKAQEEQDVFYVMEGFRQSSFLFTQLKSYKEAWIDCMLSLEAGSMLGEDIRRSGSFLFSAQLAMEIARQQPRPSQDITILEEAFKTLIGDDWKTLLQGQEKLTSEYLQQEVNQQVKQTINV